MTSPSPRGGHSVPDKFSEEQLQVFARQMLCGQLFVGNYCERSYVSQIKSYRDVVELCTNETILRDALETTQANILKHYRPETLWTGITRSAESPDKLRLHVCLKDVAFGSYWFLLKKVKFTATEVVLQLQCLRPYVEEVKEPQSGQAGPHWDVLLDDWKQALLRGAGTVLAVDNVRQAAMLVLVTAVGLVTAVFHLIRNLGDITIRLLHEISGLVRALTPVTLAILDFFAKIVGGAYLLVAMVFRGRGPAVPPNLPRRSPLLGLTAPPHHNNYRTRRY